MNENKGRRVGLYARVSTLDQNADNQLLSLRKFAADREWHIVGEYVDQGISGVRDKRPALDLLMDAAKKRQVDIVLVWRFDRFSRSLKALILALETFRALGVQFVSQQDAVDTTTPLGQLTFALAGAFGQFEREILRERVRCGLQRAVREGKKLGRPRRPLIDMGAVDRLRAEGKSIREAVRTLGIPRSSFWRATAHKAIPIQAVVPVESQV